MYNIDNSIDKKYVFKSQIDKIRNDLSMENLDENEIDRIISIIIEYNLKQVEGKLIKTISDKAFITKELISEVYDYLKYHSGFDLDGINSILKILIESNNEVYDSVSSENKRYKEAIEKRNLDSSEKFIDYGMISIKENETHAKSVSSLNLDVSFYITMLNECTTYDEVESILPNKDVDNYLDIINLVLLYYYNELLEAKKFLRELYDEEIDNYKKILLKKIEYIKKYKKILTTTSEKIVKRENIIIFLTTPSGNVSVKNDIEKDVDPSHYVDMKQILESIKDGTFKGVKQLSSNSPLAGLSEVRAHPRQSRITFKRLKENIYVVLQAFVKKSNVSSMHQNAMISRYDLYKNSVSSILEKVKDPAFILENQNMYEEIREILNDQKRGGYNGRVVK